MEKLEIPGTEDSPAIYIDKTSGIFEISGRSLTEDAVAFYEPLVNWITSYKLQPNPSTDFTFKLDYFNTSSSKIILDLIGMLSKIKGMRIIWYYQQDDEEVLEAGEEFSEQVDVPFEFRVY